MDATALFKQYETEYCNKSTEISRKIGAIASLSGDMRKRKVTEVQADLKDADNTIKKLDMEALSVSPDASKALQAKVKEYKADLSSLKSQLQQAQNSASGGDAARAELGLSTDYATSSTAQRDRMLTATQRLDKTSDRLATGKKLLAETEDLGAGILSNLAAQRETIVHSRDTLHGADDNITKARKILSNMTRRILQNKLIMFAIIGVLLAGIILIIVFKIK